MKIFIICSKHFYHRVNEVKEELEKMGHIITLPNSFEEPMKEEEMKKLGHAQHLEFKQKMMKLHEPKILANDAVLALNFKKNNQENYIGGGTFMEIVKAWELNKKIFLYNPILECIFADELKGINPIILNGDLSKIAQKKIEVEVQSFISKEEYDKLFEFFVQNAEFVNEDFQETYYFDENSNLRIQKNNDSAKLWHKTGKVHDELMEEIEIQTKREDFEKLEKFLNKLGHQVKIKWLRNRAQFDWQGIKVCLDYTKGYGYIIELEKITPETEAKKTLAELNEKLIRLGIQKTQREIFDEKFNYYKNNWRNLI